MDGLKAMIAVSRAAGSGYFMLLDRPVFIPAWILMLWLPFSARLLRYIFPVKCYALYGNKAYSAGSCLSCPKAGGTIHMMFDRKAPGEGVEIECIPENGKMLLVWKFKFTGELSEAFVSVTVKDREGNRVLECLSPEPEEEPLTAILLHPWLWQGVENPYLYRMEAILSDRQGRLLDRIVRPLPLRRLEKHPDKGYLLNGTEFAPRTVGYELPHVPGQPKSQGKIFEDLELIIQLGANSIYCGETAVNIGIVRELCDRLGLLMWHEEPEIYLRGKGQCLLDAVTDGPLSLYYQYKVQWSRQPFVSIVPESVTAVEGGCFNALVCSNCKRVALYTDGALFEVHTGEREFLFEGIPAKSPCVMLSAEADGCTVSLSIQKSGLRTGFKSK